MRTVQEILCDAKAASQSLKLLSSEKKSEILLAMADALERESDAILAANAEDIKENGERLGDVMVDRLRLDYGRICAMASGMRSVAELPDPIGDVLESGILQNGLKIEKIRVPLGVIGIIYESRPNVTSDAGALCFKSGNVCILRGGKEAIRT